MINRFPLWFIALAGALMGICLLALLGWHARSTVTTVRQPESTAATPTRLVLMPCKVADGIYLIGDLVPAAVYVVETRDGLALIDSGLEAEYEKIASALPRLGLDLQRVKMILLTHAHGDHTMGAERLRRETGAKVYVGRDDAATLREGGPWEAIFSKFDMPPGVTAHPTTIDGELTDGEVLTLGEARITTIATPGHTLGSVCYLVEHRAQRALFTGDTVMSLSDGLGTYSTYLPPKYRGEVDDYLHSLRKLRGLAAPDLVLPGHPHADPIAQNPRLTRHYWESLLDRGITELEVLAERYARDGADFLDGNPKQLAEGLFYLGDLQQTAVYAVVSSDASLLFDAAIGDDPTDFLAAAWKELHFEPPPVAAVLLTSCREQNLAGLAKLTAETGCRVVASPAGIDSAAARCSNGASLISTDDLAALGWPELEALATPGRDETAVVYRLQLGEARVLVSGDLLVESEKAILPKVVAALTEETWDTERLAESLLTLEANRPNLWLSARPLYGRNASLYDFEWEDVLAINREVLRRYQLKSRR